MYIWLSTINFVLIVTMDLIHGYKTSKQNSALLEIFTKSFPGNLEITQGLEQLLNKNESTIARLKKRW